MSSFLYRLGRASFRHRFRTLGIWLVILAVLGGLAAGFGGKFNDEFTVPGASSTNAWNQLKVTFPEAADATATVLITAPPGEKMTDSSVRSAVAAWDDTITAIPFVNGTVGPYNDHISGLISEDGRSGRVTIRVATGVGSTTDAMRDQLTATAETLETTLPGSQVLVGGDIYSTKIPKITIIEALGLAVAIVVLLLTLGSVTAAMMPVATALAGVGSGVTLIFLAAGVISVNSTTLILAIMLGLAVGIDYALFIISRHRDQLGTGMDVEESAARSVGTAGGAVVFAGTTVVIALVGLSLAGLPFLTTMGAFASVTVAIEVAMAITLLPAFMGLAGERLRPRPRAAAKAARRASGGGFKPAQWWVKTVTTWPIVTVVVVLAGMGALAYPMTNLQLALPTSQRSLPGTQDRVTFDAITDKFGIGTNGPLVMMVPIVESDDPMKVLDGLKADIEEMPGVARVAAAVPNPNVDTGMIQIVPATGPDDPATADLVQRLRDRADEWQQRYDVSTDVTGFTAIQIDVTERLREAMLPFGLFVVGLSLILLMMVFRSIWVPIKAALGYLLSVGAAFGATTLVFNEGWFGSVVNLPEPGPVISFLPIILMGILFGLAMDYEVFLVSRMREEHVHGNPNSVVDGFVHSAKVVVAAAIIMFSVFAFFVPHGEGTIKAIAFSLAVGVALDAFVVRMTLVPAVMVLLGDHAWWLPRWLDRILPSFDVEGEALTRQLELASWPSPQDNSAIVAEGLSASVGDRTLFRDLDVRLERGGLLVIEGEHAQRRALLLALAGRLNLQSGKLKTLGLVLPEEAPVLREQAPVLGPTTPHFGRILTRQRGGIVFVDSADELSSTQEHSLRRAMNATPDGEAITWVLSVSADSPLVAQLNGGQTIVRMPSHFALEGANR